MRRCIGRLAATLLLLPLALAAQAQLRGHGGPVRALAISSLKRSPLVPDLPTMEEAGVPGYEMVGWNGVFIPKGTPDDIAGKLHAALVAVLGSTAVKEQMAGLGADAIGNPQGEFAAFVKAESARWGAIIREKGIKPE